MIVFVTVGRRKCLDVSVARSLRIPSDWGLEIGVLSEVYGYPNARICQVDIAADYDHKHQPLSDEDKTTGLHRMSRDITKLFSRLTASGLTLTQESFRTLRASYMRTTFELIDHYESDAISNDMSYDREQKKRWFLCLDSRSLKQAKISSESN